MALNLDQRLNFSLTRLNFFPHPVRALRLLVCAVMLPLTVLSPLLRAAMLSVRALRLLVRAVMLLARAQRLSMLPMRALPPRMRAVMLSVHVLRLSVRATMLLVSPQRLSGRAAILTLSALWNCEQPKALIERFGPKYAPVLAKLGFVKGSMSPVSMPSLIDRTGSGNK